MTESFRQWGQGRFHYGKFETIGTEKTSGMKVRDNGTGRTSRWGVWDSWDREDFRVWSLRQQGQGGLQDGKFETVGMEKTSGQGVWNNGDRGDFRMGNMRQLGQRRLDFRMGCLRQWGQGGLQDGEIETVRTEKTSGQVVFETVGTGMTSGCGLQQSPWARLFRGIRVVHGKREKLRIVHAVWDKVEEVVFLFSWLAWAVKVAVCVCCPFPCSLSPLWVSPLCCLNVRAWGCCFFLYTCVFCLYSDGTATLAIQCELWLAAAQTPVAFVDF